MSGGPSIDISKGPTGGGIVFDGKTTLEGPLREKQEQIENNSLNPPATGLSSSGLPPSNINSIEQNPPPGGTIPGPGLPGM